MSGSRVGGCVRAPKANCARGVMDLSSEVFLFRMMIWVIRLSGCSVLQKAFLRMVFGIKFLEINHSLSWPLTLQIGSFAKIPEDESSLQEGRTLKKPRAATDLSLQVVKKGKQISWQMNVK